MKKTKKVTFESLKPGAKFRYERKLYVKDDCTSGCGIALASGHADWAILCSTLVTPVKVKIRVL